MDGIVIVDKPAGWTSQDVTARLRRVFGTRRIGHGGTLDPMATGVLPVFVGRATRAVEFFESAEKSYTAGLRLGLRTDTEDITGTVLGEAPVSVTREQLEDVLSRFTGEIQQIPPMYSAIKINGQKLCNLARSGKEVARPPRTIRIFSLTLLEFAPPSARIQVHCSKGTYVRTLCKDIGEALGCGGCMESLRRTSAGAYTLEQSVPLETLLESEDPGQYLLPADSLFTRYPALTASRSQEKKCRNGAAFLSSVPDGTYRVYSAEKEFLALSKAENGTVSTIKSFFTV